MVEHEQVMSVDYSHPLMKLGDGAAALGVFGTVMGWLPAIAAILGVVWYLILIFSWVEKRIKERKEVAKGCDPGGSGNPNYPNVQ